MSKSFPHISDTAFPNVGNVNVYEYRNEFDYSKFANSQMHIKLMSVPWDLGEVHVGLKSIPMGNVVSFDDDKERDKWLNAQTGLEFDTRYKAYHASDEIKLPVPFESCAMFNYLVIDYEEPPVNYGNMPRISRWLYFIRDIKMESVNSTICTIQRDSWQMFSNSVDISYMLLERGHAPMFEAATPAQYLNDPINNTAGLLAQDANFGAATISKSVSRWVPSEGEQVLVFCLYANANDGDWGKKSDNTWCVPRQVYKTKNGALASHVMAIDAADANDFLTNVDADVPQFLQCVEACFTVAKSLVSLGDSFTFAGVKCYPCTGTASLDSLALPTVEQFGYPEEFANVTKLYTFPYAHLELTNEQGETTEINIEDCSGNALQVRSSLSLALPWLRLDAQVNGVGGGSSKLTFKNLTDHTFTHGGEWYKILRRWDIPCMQVQQGNNKTNDYRTHYDRLSNSEVADANATTTTEDAATDTAAKAKIAAENADTLTDNTATQCSANTTMTARSATGATKDTTLGNELNTAIQAWNAGMARELVNNSSDASIQSAGIAAAGNILSSTATGAIAGASGGALVGSVVPGAGTAAGALVGGVGGAIAGVASGVVSGMQTGVAINANSDQAEIQISNSDAIKSSTNTNNTQRTSNQNSVNKDNTATQNTASKTIASRSASCTTANQATQNSATNAIAKNDAANMRDVASIQNKRQQDSAHIQAPNTFGRATDADNVTRPQGLWLQVVKQPADCVAMAANEFLRYGYRYNQMYDFRGFNLGKRFTYWKAADIWMTAKNLPDAFVDEVRNYLLQGVTIWRKPEYINNSTIYENGI